MSVSVEPAAAACAASPPWPEGAAWMAGRWSPVGEAKISVLDWGFIHADVVYDVVHVWNGAFFRLNDHIERFLASIRAAEMGIEQDAAEIAAILNGCVARAGLPESYVAMVASRGRTRVPGSRDPRDCANHFFAYAVPFIWVPGPDQPGGFSVKIARTVRRIPPDSVDPLAKNYHWGDFTRGLLEAKPAGFDSVLLLDHQGCATEGPGFNLFVVTGGRAATPNQGCLMGITRRTVIEMLRAAGTPVEERPISEAELLAADEVFLSSSGGGVRPVTRLDDRILGNGAPGPITAALSETYWRWHDDPKLSTPVDYAIDPARGDALR